LYQDVIKTKNLFFYCTNLKYYFEKIKKNAKKYKNMA
jgi:hypothetical protein